MSNLPTNQNNSMTNLLKVLNSKKATAALTAIGKTKDSTWNNIEQTVVGLNELVRAGSIQETLETQVSAILSPFKNEINQLMTDALAPLQTLMTDINNEISTFIADNKTGAAIGGIAGQIAGMFLPGGPILIAVGALFGAAIEELFSRIGTLDVVKTVQDAADTFAGTDFGDRMARLLDLLEEEQRDPVSRLAIRRFVEGQESGIRGINLFF